MISYQRVVIICDIQIIISYYFSSTSTHLENFMHHICDTLWRLPPKEELQSLLENYTTESDPLLQNKKLINIFASALADRTRSPSALRMNIHLVIKNHENEIPRENRSDIFKLFNRVLRDIAIKYSSH